MSPLFAAGLFGLGLPEIILLAILGVLFFGRRLPEVSKYLGKSIIEFKKGMRGLEDNLDDGASYGAAAPSHPAATEPIRPPQRVVATAPKFEDTPASTHVTAHPPQV